MFSDRYAFIRPSALRALNSIALAEVGLAVTLLDGRLEIAIRVEQLNIQATNLRNSQELRFAQDCVMLTHALISETLSEATMPYINLRLAHWLTVDGGKDEVNKQFRRIAKPARSGLDKNFLSAGSIEQWLRIMFKNDTVGWRLSISAEPSAMPDADLYVLRDYLFDTQLEMDTVEKRFSFAETSGKEIAEWLGFGSLREVA